MRRLMIDITHTANHNYHTGIQRVSRCLARESLKFSETSPIECFPIINLDGQFVHVGRGCIARGYQKSSLDWQSLAKSLIPPWVSTSHRLKLNSFGTRARKLLYPRTIDRKLRKLVRTWQSPPTPANPGRGDVILMPDAWWDLPEMFDAIQQARQGGALVGGMIHDLIPIRFPEFFDQQLRDKFTNWMEKVVQEVDFIIGDAKVAEDDLKSYVQQQNAPLADWQVGHVRLGCDIDLKVDINPSRIPSEIRKLFQDRKTAPYLMVSTLEIRKNHHYLIDAFENLWREGQDVSLALVGRIGWKCDDLIQRIADHPEAGKRLHLLNNVNDATLKYLYEKSKAFLFSSKAEGFGLPIVEAMHNGLHVFASDIPIFREVAGPSGNFFSLENPADLSQQIVNFEKRQGWKTAPTIEVANEPWNVVFPKLVDTVTEIAETILAARRQASLQAA